MNEMTSLWVDRGDLRRTKVATAPAPAAGDGEIVVRIDRFGLTSNNVSYAVTGDSIGYWRFYPADEGWGRVPVWGFADVIASRAEGVEVGERLYGFFPISSHAVLKPGRIRDGAFFDVAEHRADLPPLYNTYSRTGGEPEALRAIEDARSLFFPLFVTSYVLFDYLTDNGFFGAGQVAIGSASSKTGFGLAKLLSELEGGPKVIGFTSAGNKAFVAGLSVYDAVLGYDEAAQVDASTKTAYVDMSGDGALTEALHRHCAANLVESCIVGATHWEAARPGRDLPGAKPAFFFAPAQMQKRDAEWGRGVLIRKAMKASARMALELGGHLEVDRLSGADAVASAWVDLLNNKVDPRRGLIGSLV